MFRAQIIAAVLGPLTYAAALLGWFLIGCTSKWYVSCTYDLQDLPFIAPVVIGIGLVVHVITASTAFAFGGIRRMRLLSTVGLYAAGGFLLLGLWQVLTGPEPVLDYLQFALTLIPFLVSGAVLGLVVWLLLGRGSNSAAHPEPLKHRSLWHPSSRRPGGRER
jgi:hypothetical protein